MIDRICNLFKKQPSIEVFVRHCHYSKASAHKERFKTFSKQKCFQNLIQTTANDSVNITFFLDTFYPTDQEHFLKNEKRYPVIEMSAGTEASSFLSMLDYVSAQKYSPETIIYFLEDDYVHKPNWVKVLKEGFTIPKVSYVTLFDHRDKYFLPSYQGLKSQLFHTDTCHWRQTPSTTNTYAMQFKTLLKSLDVHRSFSTDRKITADHDKFCSLAEMGEMLISSIPGWATHVEPEFVSPCADWEKILESTH